jgi:pimeloyl-ACP methyl ester carboxylesterase
MPWSKFLTIIMFCSLYSCFTFRQNDKSTLKQGLKIGVNLQVAYHSFHGIKYRYCFLDKVDAKYPLLVLIHGAPGSSDSFLKFLENKTISNQYSVAIVDRLGYGYSDYGHYADILKQSDAAVSLIRSIKMEGQKVFITGHSYGATIAAAMATQQPEFLTATAILAPALDPDIEKYFWFGKLGIWKATRWMASGALRTAADEKYNHAEDLKKFTSSWGRISTPILHVHGDKDILVPFENLSFARQVIPKSSLEVYVWKGENHFFPFSKQDETIQILDNFFSKYK